MVSVYETGLLISIASYGFSALAAPLFGKRFVKAAFYASSLLTLFTLLYIAAAMGSEPYVTVFSGAVVFDKYSLFLVTMAVTVFLLAGLGAHSVTESWDAGDAFYAVLSLIALGLVAIGFARTVYLAYTAWIMAAVSAYILIAMRKNGISAETAIKYGITGSVATILLLLGVALYYIVHGDVYMAPGLLQTETIFTVPVVALAIIAAGFKMGVVPFHAWAVDVYGNARPVAVAAAAALAKLIVALLVIKLLTPFAQGAPHTLFWVAALLAILTMFYGNLGGAAAVKDSPQKALAYSSVGQAGYIVVGFATLASLAGINTKAALAGIALHTVAYAFSKLASFQVLDAACGDEPCKWERLRGLAHRSPAAAIAMTIALMNLMGLPFTLGFWSKLYLLVAAASASAWLAFLMLLNFAIAAYYYGYMLYQLVQKPSQETPAIRDDYRVYAALIAALITIALAVQPWKIYGIPLYGYTTPP
jgi:NADH:ubiquinone oxidoreductase subunit 2 (subunit N)